MDLATALANTDLVWWPTVIRSFDVDTDDNKDSVTASLANVGTALEGTPEVCALVRLA